MGWIDTEKEKPSSPFHVVFITDGECTWLARWIADPKDWYGDELEEEEYESHWLFEDVGPFNGNDECFVLTPCEITHWMNLPKPLRKQNAKSKNVRRVR